jgi:hypothetical protein
LRLARTHTSLAYTSSDQLAAGNSAHFVARGTCAWITFDVVVAKALGESQETLAGMMIAHTYGFALRRESKDQRRPQGGSGCKENRGALVCQTLESSRMGKSSPNI